MIESTAVNISQRYITARHTSNMHSDPRTRMSPCDVLTAAGMAAQDNEAALLLWGIAYEGKASDMHRLVEVMARPMRARMARNRQHGNVVETVQSCIAWWLSKCDVCGGRGNELIPHTSIRSEEPCSACHGTGKLPMPDNAAFLWLASELDRLQSIAGGKIMQRLAFSMDL